jgi:hypothetical protein
MMGAVQSVGSRAKILWTIGVAFAAMGFAYYQWAASQALMTVLVAIWSIAPVVAVMLCLIIVSGREPRKIESKINNLSSKEKPSLNPALTPQFLNNLIEGATDLESKNRLSQYSNQIMKVCAQVKDVREDTFMGGITVHVIGMYKRFSDDWLNDTTMRFEKSQRDSLTTIKRGDWIEFTGRVQSGGPGGWHLVDCIFVSRSTAPAKTRARRNKDT